MDLPIPLEEPVTSAHSASYFFFRFCVGSAEKASTCRSSAIAAEQRAEQHGVLLHGAGIDGERHGGERGRLELDKCSRASARRV